VNLKVAWKGPRRASIPKTNRPHFCGQPHCFGLFHQPGDNTIRHHHGAALPIALDQVADGPKPDATALRRPNRCQQPFPGRRESDNSRLQALPAGRSKRRERHAVAHQRSQFHFESRSDSFDATMNSSNANELRMLSRSRGHALTPRCIVVWHALRTTPSNAGVDGRALAPR
jgi:hypothetical protein